MLQRRPLRRACLAAALAVATLSTIFTQPVSAQDEPRANVAELADVIVVSAQHLVTGQTSENYSGRLTASGGQAPYTWTIEEGGSNPCGLSFDHNTGEFSGRPDNCGTVNLKVSATDNNGVSSDGSWVTLHVENDVGEFTGVGMVLETAIIGEEVSYEADGLFDLSEGVAPFVWTGPDLPSGLQIDSSTGRISGIAVEASGGFPDVVYVTVTDAIGQSGMVMAAIWVVEPGVQLSPWDTFGFFTSQPNKGEPFSRQLHGIGGVAPYSYAIDEGELPPGLGLNPTTGEISGTPTEDGTWAAQIQVTDSTGATSPLTNLSLFVSGPTFNADLPVGYLDTEYYGWLNANLDGPLPYTFAITSGSLPPGLTLDPTQGNIYGVPTSTGTFEFTVQVSSDGGQSTLEETFTIEIWEDQVVVHDSYVFLGRVGHDVSVKLTASGGHGPYTWSVAMGDLPSSLRLNAQTGVISGRLVDEGVILVMLVATDANGVSSRATLVQMYVAGPLPPVEEDEGLRVTTRSLPKGQVGAVYSGELAADGGDGQYTWSMSPEYWGGGLPSGLVLNSRTGGVSGVPHPSGISGGFGVVVSDATSSVEAFVDISILAEDDIGIRELDARPAALGQFYTFTMTPLGGEGPYVWTLDDEYSDMPPGIGFDDHSGTFSGLPTRAGDYWVRLEVTDDHGRVGTVQLDITVEADATVGPGGFSGLSPVRALNTRAAGGSCIAKGQRVKLDVAGKFGVPEDAAAVTFNLTVPGGATDGFITVYPSGTTMPRVSNLNIAPKKTVANAVTTEIGADGAVMVYSEKGCQHVILDVTGYYVGGDPGDGGFEAVERARILNTRSSSCVGSQGREFTIDQPGADSVVLNVTVTQPTAAGYLTLYPDGAEQPYASNLNFARRQTVANQVTVKVGSNGKVKIFASGGCPDVLVDIAGYYHGGSDTVVGGFVGIAPQRMRNTRQDYRSSCTAGSIIDADIAGLDGIPYDATGVVMNVTVTEAKGAGFITVYPGDTHMKRTSTVNFVKGQTVPNAAISRIGENRRVEIYAESGCPHVLVDVAGYFTGPKTVLDVPD